MKLRLDEKRIASLCAVLAIGLLGGCARYEYVLVEPSRFAGPIGKEPVRVDYEPMEYVLARKSDRLQVTISNRTDHPVTVAGQKSYVVDPHGQTRALPGAGIAARSYIGLVLPPEPPSVRAAPSISFGFGLGYSSYHGHGPYFSPGFGYYHGPVHDPAPYYRVESTHYWEWKSGQVQLRLFYEQSGTNTFEHNFIFLRQKRK